MFRHLPTSVPYREDINGLRAWAVIAVLLFHFSLFGLPGGFVGVDIFFVISGYLMTAIIVGSYEKGGFSIWQFYMSRIRRIVPALLVLIATLLTLGWFWLPEPDYKELSIQSSYSSVFLSNLYYWKSAGYFDSAAEEKWLLHTWSLAVEAQFYVFYPIFIAFVWKFWGSIKSITHAVLLVFGISFALNLIVSFYDPNASFYLLPTRGWELAAGGLVYLISKQISIPHAIRYASYWLGWLLLIASFVLISDQLVWPSYWTILPVLGTSLIILAYRENCLLTNNFLAQWLGDRSYSLYLWHWPLVVLLFFAGLHSQWGWVISAFFLSIFLAAMSYRFIEVPTRQFLSQAKLLKEVVVIAIAIVLVATLSVFLSFISFNDRLPKAIEEAASESKNKSAFRYDCYKQNTKSEQPVSCLFNEMPLGVILIGDSHADAVFTSLGAAASKFDRSAMYWAKPACPMLKNAKLAQHERNKGCLEFNNAILDDLDSTKQNIPAVLIARYARYLYGGNEPKERFPDRPRMYFSKELSSNSPVFLQEFSDSFVSTVCQLKQTRDVYLVRPIPEMGFNVPNKLARDFLWGREQKRPFISLEDYKKRSDFIWRVQDLAAEKCGAKILNPLPYLCDEENCYATKNGRSLYFDDNHLSEYGNKLLVPMFETIFEDK